MLHAAEGRVPASRRASVGGDAAQPGCASPRSWCRPSGTSQWGGRTSKCGSKPGADKRSSGDPRGLNQCRFFVLFPTLAKFSAPDPGRLRRGALSPDVGNQDPHEPNVQGRDADPGRGRRRHRRSHGGCRRETPAGSGLRRIQVLCITHLPQIAAWADHHYRIAKTIRGNRTVTRSIGLTLRGAEQELARMIAGQSVSDRVLASADDMLAERRRAKGEARPKGESESRHSKGRRCAAVPSSRPTAAR